MQVKCIAECSKESILQYFRPSFSNHLSVRSLFCLFLSGCFTQGLHCILLWVPWVSISLSGCTPVQKAPQFFFKNWNLLQLITTGPLSTVGSVSDCRSRGCKFNPGPVPYFCGDWSGNNFYGHSPPFRWFKRGCFQLQVKVCARSTG